MTLVREEERVFGNGVGSNTSGNFNVGYDVYFDAQNAEYITIEDGVWFLVVVLFFVIKEIYQTIIKGTYIRIILKICPVHICRMRQLGWIL